MTLHIDLNQIMILVRFSYVGFGINFFQIGVTVNFFCSKSSFLQDLIEISKGLHLVPHITRFLLAWFPLTRILAYVRASGEFRVS